MIWWKSWKKCVTDVQYCKFLPMCCVSEAAVKNKKLRLGGTEYNGYWKHCAGWIWMDIFLDVECGRYHKETFTGIGMLMSSVMHEQVQKNVLIEHLHFSENVKLNTSNLQIKNFNVTLFRLCEVLQQQKIGVYTYFALRYPRCTVHSSTSCPLAVLL